MTAENQQELWEVEVGGKIYHAEMAELPEWIGEGSLLPEDKIRKGNLRWIEARKVPALIPFFNAKEKGETLPVVQTISEPGSAEHAAVALPETSVQTLQVSRPTPEVSKFVPEPRPHLHGTPDESECSRHSGLPSFYICGSCNEIFCKGCPKSYGGNVKICPKCDALCTPITQAAEKKKLPTMNAASLDEGFGISDLFRSAAYPLQYKTSLLFGGLMFMFFTLGQGAALLGGIFLVVGALFCVMFSNMLTFGIMANTVENFIAGRLEVDFMPSFEEFSLWDDVIHPFFLSIGVYISSFGPAFLVALLGAYLVSNAIGAQQKAYQDQIKKVPGTEFYAPDRTAEQSQQVKDLLAKVKEQNDRRLAQQQDAANGDATLAPTFDPAEMEKVLNEARPAQPKPEQDFAQFTKAALSLAAPLVIFGGLALLWGLFYFPAACAVAGYTRSFVATINPLVGLDTIKRLGSSYLKLLLMCLVIALASGAVSLVLSALLAPLNLPTLGNIPARAIGSLFGFYFWVVFSCLLGFTLFKAGDRLKLCR